ncbi:ABC transporter ATP-binding protein [bacterium]|nr:ABC transporter ATP-binding protein [bacterium]
MSEMNSLVQVEHLEKKFPVSSGLFKTSKSFIHAVDDINFEISPGSSLGLVGESGCGKTTTGKLLTRLYDPSAGHIFFNDPKYGKVDLATLKGADLKEFRSRVQIIFQDPYESLNPRRTIYDTVAEPLVVQGIGNITQREQQVAQLLETVGLTPATSFMFRYPHELSGGQRQRVAIARALVVNPSFVVADEPTSMLDVSIRIGVMQLMMELAQELDVSYLYITHDLAVARYMCQRIAVMYIGKIIEKAPTEDLLAHPLHPYTRALISAVPVPDPTFQREAIPIKGGVSAPIDPPDQCRFYTRCPLADNFCRDNPHPSLEDKGNGHFAACYKV